MKKKKLYTNIYINNKFIFSLYNKNKTLNQAISSWLLKNNNRSK